MDADQGIIRVERNEDSKGLEIFFPRVGKELSLRIYCLGFFVGRSLRSIFMFGVYRKFMFDEGQHDCDGQ